MTQPSDVAGTSLPDRGEPIFSFYRFRDLPVVFIPIGSTPNLSYFVASAQTAIRQLDDRGAAEDELLSKLARFALSWGLQVRRTDRDTSVEVEVERRRPLGRGSTTAEQSR
jgi:hypothetical protein